MQVRHSRGDTLRATFAVQQRVLGPEHPNTLHSAENLAAALRDEGKYAAAEEIHCETLAVLRRVLGPLRAPEHVDHSQQSVAGALQAQGKQTEAEAVSLETFAVQRRVLGPERPSTLTTANKLATALTLQGKHVEAEVRYLKTICG
jgi:hypothetical protein